MRKFLRVGKYIVFFLLVAAFVCYLLFLWMRQDNIAPTLQVPTDILRVSAKVTTEELLQGVTATDDRDGDVTSSVMVESLSTFDTNMQRTVTYVAFDSAGNVSRATRQLMYTDYTSPQFKLSGEMRMASVTIDNVLKFVTAGDSLDGDLTNQIEIVDYNVRDTAIALYDVTLSVSNSAGDTSTVTLPVWLTGRNLSQPRIVLSDYLVYRKVGEKPNWYSYIKELQSALTDEKLANAAVSITNAPTELERGTYIIRYSISSRNGYIGVAYLTVVAQ